MTMQRIRGLFCFILSGLLLLTLCEQANAATREEPLDRIIATVNNSVITQSQLDKALANIKLSLRGTSETPPDAATLRKQVLDQLINNQLQLQAAKTAGITVTEKEIDNALQMIAKQNKFSVDELYRQVTAQGMTRKEYRKELRNEITLQKVEQQAVGNTVTLTADEMKKSDAEKRDIWNHKFEKALEKWISLLRSQATITLHTGA